MKRIAFLSPDIPHARSVVDELLQQGIDRQHIYTITPKGIDREDLPGPGTEADDFLPGYIRGLVIGGVAGLVAGVILYFLQTPTLEVGAYMVFLVTLLGAGIGGFGTGISAAAFSNTRLDEFRQELTKGKILVMADVKPDDEEEIETAVKASDPASRIAGTEPPPKIIP